MPDAELRAMWKAGMRTDGWMADYFPQVKNRPASRRERQYR